MTEIIAVSEDWEFLCLCTDVEPGEIGTTTHPLGHELAIYNVNDEFYVTDDTCSHGEASLSDEGELEGYAVECGWHNGTFDVRTGRALTLPCRKSILSYATKIEDDSVYFNTIPTPLNDDES